MFRLPIYAPTFSMPITDELTKYTHKSSSSMEVTTSLNCKKRLWLRSFSIKSRKWSKTAGGSTDAGGSSWRCCSCSCRRRVVRCRVAVIGSQSTTSSNALTVAVLKHSPSLLLSIAVASYWMLYWNMASMLVRLARITARHSSRKSSLGWDVSPMSMVGGAIPGTHRAGSSQAVM